MEIRPVRENELDTFLRLLCHVFDLEFSRAQGIFQSEPMFELSRKWALFEGTRMLSILSTVPLEFGWGKAAGIAGVATHPDHRGRGLAQKLLEEVLRCGQAIGEGPTLLFAKDTVVYDRAGFRVLDRVVRANVVESPAEGDFPDIVDFDYVVKAYTNWSCEHPMRLRRDGRRWNYWKWNLRTCSAFEGGYLCNEGNLLRECFFDGEHSALPVAPGTEWYGLETLARGLGVPIVDPQWDLHLMGHGFDAVPQMFMTDQF